MKPKSSLRSGLARSGMARWVWRVVDVLSLAVIALTIGVAFVALAQAQAVFI